MLTTVYKHEPLHKIRSGQGRVIYIDMRQTGLQLVINLSVTRWRSHARLNKCDQLASKSADVFQTRQHNGLWTQQRRRKWKVADDWRKLQKLLNLTKIREKNLEAYWYPLLYRYKSKWLLNVWTVWQWSELKKDLANTVSIIRHDLYNLNGWARRVMKMSGELCHCYYASTWFVMLKLCRCSGWLYLYRFTHINSYGWQIVHYRQAWTKMLSRWPTLNSEQCKLVFVMRQQAGLWQWFFLGGVLEHNWEQQASISLISMHEHADLLCYNCMLYLSYHFVCMHVYFVFSLFSGLFSFVDFPSVLW